VLMKREAIVLLGILSFSPVSPSFSITQTESPVQEKYLDTVPDDSVLEETFFGPGGGMVASIRKSKMPEGLKECVVINGKAEGWYDWIRRPVVFSLSGARIAYVAAVGGRLGENGEYTGGQWYMVTDGKKGEAYERIDPYASFTFDGSQITYCAELNGQSVIVVGDGKYRDSDLLLPPVEVSRDGKKVAYVGERIKGDLSEMFVIQNGKPGKSFDKVGIPKYSPDGTTLAFLAQSEGRWFVVVGEKMSGPYDLVWDPVFNPDGQSLAFSAKISKDGKKAWFKVIGQERGPMYDAVGHMIFSPDGKSHAYVAVKAGSALVVCKEKEGPPFEWVGEPSYSADGNHLTYAARRREDKRKWLLIVDDVTVASYDYVDQPRFIEGQSSVSFGARIGRECWRKVAQYRN
jgi:WD40 repeat protein